jgi:hypothetical protein
MLKRSTMLFLGGAAILLAAALLVGISDNPPGLVLMYAAMASFILAFTHRWRSTKQFMILLVASLVGFPLTAVLHNAFYALGELLPTIKPVAGAIHVVFFLAAILLCPVGVVIGAVGSVVTWWHHRRGPQGSTP